MDRVQLKRLLDDRVAVYNRPSFIAGDPICIPHSFSLRQDIEIAGLFAAVLAWGNRTTIINNCRRLMGWMDNSPYQFICQHAETDLKRFTGFAHRTFNATDLLYFIDFLHRHYAAHSSLEDAFVPGSSYAGPHVGEALICFRKTFFAGWHPERTMKHISTPEKNSACKRLNMYLRWMVRKDHKGVDLGLWSKINTRQLICPLDVHVARVAERLGLLETNKADWNSALRLTSHLRELNPEDPAVYDFALFGLGAEERF